MSLGFFVALPGPLSAAEKITDRSKQKQIAEAERAGLQQRLSALRQDIDRTETAKGRATDALATADTAISQANRALRELATEEKQTGEKLARLTKEQAELAKQVATQQTQLAKLLRERYVAGNEDRIKLLLSGDNPNRINRDLQYLGYVSQAQAKLIDNLRVSMQAVEANRLETQNAKDELTEITSEQREQKTVLEKQKSERATILAQLSSKLANQRKEAGDIERDDQRLGGLVERLAKLIEEQQKAEAAEREKRRLEAIEREKRRIEQVEKAKAAAQAAKQALAKRSPSSGKITNPATAITKSSNPDAIDKDEPPPQSLGKNELIPDADVQEAASGQSFARLRGQLRLPLRGELTAKFGSRRADGPASKGIFIRAPEGSDIRVIAAGRVVFADWLRGFGNLIIVDHGNQYLTIYGNNQSVLKRAGEFVKTGDIIASAGNSGGNGQSGLYFEIRHQGRAFDPLDWVTTR